MLLAFIGYNHSSSDVYIVWYYDRHLTIGFSDRDILLCHSHMQTQKQEKPQDLKESNDCLPLKMAPLTEIITFKSYLLKTSALHKSTMQIF